MIHGSHLSLWGESLQEEGQSASVPTGLGQKIICGKEFALRVRQLAASSAASFTLHFRCDTALLPHVFFIANVSLGCTVGFPGAAHSPMQTSLILCRLYSSCHTRLC